MFSLMIYSRALHVTLCVSTDFLNIDANCYDSRPTSQSLFISNLGCDMSGSGDMFIIKFSCCFFLHREGYDYSVIYNVFDFCLVLVLYFYIHHLAVRERERER